MNDFTNTPGIDNEYWIVNFSVEKVRQTSSLIYGKKGMPISLGNHITQVFINKFKENAIDELIEYLNNNKEIE